MGFHEGELAVQQRAGVSAEARRLVGMLDPAQLRGGAGRFLRERTLAVLTGRDQAGRLWTSPLLGPPGFLDSDGDQTLRIHARPAAGDPLHELAAGQLVGLLVIDLATRRRLRVNGRLTALDSTGLEVAVREAYGNCPQYIHPRQVELVDGEPAGRAAVEDGELRPSDLALIERADTFFLGTTHPERGPDASHRGGPPGFVTVDGEAMLRWRDFPGNNMFNSFGNLAVDDAAALLFVDFVTGATLSLSGTAVVEWEPRRQVRFSVERLVRAQAPLALRAAS